MNATNDDARMEAALKHLANAAAGLTRAMDQIERACGVQSARCIGLNIARAAINAEIEDIKKTWFQSPARPA